MSVDKKTVIIFVLCLCLVMSSIFFHYRIKHILKWNVTKISVFAGILCIPNKYYLFLNETERQVELLFKKPKSPETILITSRYENDSELFNNMVNLNGKESKIHGLTHIASEDDSAKYHLFYDDKHIVFFVGVDEDVVNWIMERYFNGILSE